MLNNLKPTPGSRVKSVRRGRGIGSGLGKTSGAGHKGQNSRSGGGVKLGFEGGQLPLLRRLPKRGSGFKNNCHKQYAVVSLDRINASFEEGSVIDTVALIEAGLINKELYGTKILNGKLEKKLTIKANKFSASALETIKNSGSTAEVIE